MFEYFYHSILRKTVISFGTLFNNIEIRKVDGDSKTISRMKVPLAYGPTQKFLARIEQQDADLNKPVQITLPRLSFEMTGIEYAPRRKTSTTQTFKTVPIGEKTATRKVYMPVPYDVKFELSLMAKTNEDALQLVEQVVPYFQPHFTLTVNLIKEIGEKRDIPVILENISMQDDYEGDYSSRRVIVYTLSFTAQTYLFGPIPTDSSGIIKRSTIDYMTNMDVKNPRREMRYSVTPRATTDYNDDAVTTLSENVGVEDTTIKVVSASGISKETYININDEELYVRSKTGNTLRVKRGQDQTVAAEHVAGQAVNLITSADDDLIEMGDDFGFNETTSFFQDFKQYSPSQNDDV